MNVVLLEISIKESVNINLSAISYKGTRSDVVYENVQARIRTSILMNKANQVGGLVVGTSDLSEMALGWSTYAGDQISMYHINSGVPKTLISHLVAWFADEIGHETPLAEALIRVVETPISPELIGDGKQLTQFTESLLGSYELNDFFLYHLIRTNASVKRVVFLGVNVFPAIEKTEIIDRLESFVARFMYDQFKRSCTPDGPKVGSIALSPRADWRMPSDVESKLWLNEISSLREQNS